MICRKATRVISEGMDRRLTGLERLSLGLHLLGCTPCRRYRRQLGLIRELLRRLAEWLDQRHVDASARLTAEARQRIQEVLEQGGHQGQ